MRLSQSLDRNKELEGRKHSGLLPSERLIHFASGVEEISPSASRRSA